MDIAVAMQKGAVAGRCEPVLCAAHDDAPTAELRARPQTLSFTDPQTFRFMLRTLLILTTLIVALGLEACVYRAAISQGNLLKDEDLEQVELGMTRSQVRFLLGTPLIDDPFHRDRWDYVYYLTIGRNPATFKRWVTIEFEDGVVSEIRKDQELSPNL